MKLIKKKGNQEADGETESREINANVALASDRLYKHIWGKENAKHHVEETRRKIKNNQIHQHAKPNQTTHLTWCVTIL